MNSTKTYAFNPNDKTFTLVLSSHVYEFLKTIAETLAASEIDQEVQVEYDERLCTDLLIEVCNAKENENV